MKFKANEFIIASSGEYSDYTIDGTYRVLKDFDFKEVLKDFIKDNPMKPPKYCWVKLKECWDDPQILEFLVDGEYLSRIKHKELHISGYSYQVTPDKILVIEND